MFGMDHSAVVCVSTVNGILQTQTLCWIKATWIINVNKLFLTGDSLLLVPLHSFYAKPRNRMHKTGSKPQVVLTIVYNGLRGGCFLLWNSPARFQN